jgi:hypothetical protein
MGTQSLPGTTQRQPGSTWQEAEQPSPLATLPSSHSSSKVWIPLPQAGWDIPHGGQPPDIPHVQSHSSLHWLEQPSPETVLPSSHSSPGSILPLPQSPALIVAASGADVLPGIMITTTSLADGTANWTAYSSKLPCGAA